MSKYHYPDNWQHPHYGETPEQRKERIKAIVSHPQYPVIRKVRPSVSVQGEPMHTKRPSFRHTTKRRGEGDHLTNNKRVVANANERAVK